jgi:membrane protein DedA with SNARE-associated domain
MPDTSEIIEWLRGLPPVGVYVALWVTTYIENVFPPSPSDVLMLFIATLIGIGTIGLVPAIAIATAGSIMGFLTAFWVGRRFGRSLVTSNKLPFVSPDSLEKVDGWFDKYGYWVIVANRFLAGTRAVISFFAGMSKLDFTLTTLLCGLSALVWNSLIIVAGWQLGDNWEQAVEILGRYGTVVSILLGALIVYLIVRWWMRRRRGDGETAGRGDGETAGLRDGGTGGKDNES